MAGDTPDYKTLKSEVDALKTSYDAQTNSTKSSSEALRNGIVFVQEAGVAFKGLITDLKNVSGHMQNNHVLLQRSAELLGLVGNAALGASKMFKDGFTDTSGIQNFTGQIDTFFANVDKLKDPIQSVTSLAMSMGIPFAKAGMQMGESLDDFEKRIHGAITALADGPDAALKFQNSFLQMAAASGNLGEVFRQTGEGLKNINGLMQTQTQVLKDAVKDTTSNTQAVTEYYQALGKIPGFLNGQVEATDKGAARLNALTAVMKLAHGTMMTEGQVMNQLSTAFHNYGVDVEKAMEFTAHISDLSQKYGVELTDVENYMTNTSAAFKFLGENIDSTAGIFDNYFKRLRDTGLSSRAAAEMTTGLAESIGQMSIAQKAFLSGQTGGPGGLMGAVQLEKDIREGKAADVMKRVETALKQQFGRIVTQQEGATSEQAAAQFVKQRMFLQQGPFGGLVKDEGQATRMLEAFAKQPGGVSQEKARDLLTKDIKRGSDVEQKSHTALTQINADTESIKMLSGIIALNTTQMVATPAAGGDLERRLLGGIKDALGHGREATTAGTKTATDRSALYMGQGVQDISQAVDMVSATVGNAGKKAKGLIETQDMVIKHYQDEYNRVAAETHRGVGVGVAAQQAATLKPKTNGPMLDKWMADINKPKPTTTAAQNITITMTSVCPDCHRKFVTHQQQKSINNAPNVVPDTGPGAGF